MATKTIFKDAKAPLLFLRNPFLPKTAAANPELIIQSIQAARPSTQKPLAELSGLCRYLYEEPAKVGLDGVTDGWLWASDTAFGLRSRVQACRSRGEASDKDDDDDDDEEDDDDRFFDDQHDDDDSDVDVSDSDDDYKVKRKSI